MKHNEIAMFNKGYKCENCGPIQTAKKKTISKIKYDVCTICDRVVVKWIRPLNERAGRCNNCGSAAFTLAVIERQLLRRCKACEMVINTDNFEIVEKGETKSEGE